jgi:hypothetical protein
MGKRQKAAAAVLGTLAAAGLMTGAVVDDPALLLEENPAIVVEEEDEDASYSEQIKKRGLSAARQWLFSLPAGVRILVAIPLWCIGWVVESGIAALFLQSGATVAQRFLGWLCLGLVLLVVFMTSTKCAFPKCPLRKILRLRNFLLPFAAAVVLGAADMALPTVWKSYDTATMIVWRAGSLCLLAWLCASELKLQGKRYALPAEESSPRTYVEQEAWRLADTVCPKR